MVVETAPFVGLLIACLGAGALPIVGLLGACFGIEALRPPPSCVGASVEGPFRAGPAGDAPAGGAAAEAAA